MFPWNSRALTITPVKNGFLVESASIGDGPGERHVFNCPARLSAWLKEWAKAQQVEPVRDCPPA